MANTKQYEEALVSRDIKTQKFWHGDLVLISDDVSEVKRNFSTGVRGIVDGSFADKFHDHNAIDQYSVHVEADAEYLGMMNRS